MQHRADVGDIAVAARAAAQGARDRREARLHGDRLKACVEKPAARLRQLGLGHRDEKMLLAAFLRIRRRARRKRVGDKLLARHARALGGFPRDRLAAIHARQRWHADDRHARHVRR